MRSISSLPVLFLFFFSPALADIFVTNPADGSKCSAGKSCTVEWVDNGVNPTLVQIGACTVGLYHGNQQLVQQLEPVNVASAQSLTFTPKANAGPNSSNYYVAFVSTRLENGTDNPYTGFSPFLTLTGMSGSFNSPVPSLTSNVPVPATISAPDTSLPVSVLSRTISISVSSATTATLGSSALASQLTPSASLTTSRNPPSPSTSSSLSTSASASARTSGAISMPHPGLTLAFSIVLASLILLHF